MIDQPRSNRPTPRTPAAIEAELRRRVRAELTQARADAEDGQIDDAALASIIARAVASVLTWHLEAPEHTRNATLSSRTWRGAGGPRGGARRDDEEGGDRRYNDRRSDDRGRFDDRRSDERRSEERRFEGRHYADRRSDERRFDDRGEDRRPTPPPYRERFERREDADERDRERDGGRDRDFRAARGPRPSGPRPRGAGGRGGFSSRGGGFGSRGGNKFRGGGFGPRRPPPRGR